MWHQIYSAIKKAQNKKKRSFIYEVWWKLSTFTYVQLEVMETGQYDVKHMFLKFENKWLEPRCKNKVVKTGQQCWSCTVVKKGQKCWSNTVVKTGQNVDLIQLWKRVKILLLYNFKVTKMGRQCWSLKAVKNVSNDELKMWWKWMGNSELTYKVFKALSTWQYLYEAGQSIYLYPTARMANQERHLWK